MHVYVVACTQTHTPRHSLSVTLTLHWLTFIFWRPNPNHNHYCLTVILIWTTGKLMIYIKWLAFCPHKGGESAQNDCINTFISPQHEEYLDHSNTHTINLSDLDIFSSIPPPRKDIPFFNTFTTLFHQCSATGSVDICLTFTIILIHGHRKLF